MSIKVNIEYDPGDWTVGIREGYWVSATVERDGIRVHSDIECDPHQPVGVWKVRQTYTSIDGVDISVEDDPKTRRNGRSDALRVADLPGVCDILHQRWTEVQEMEENAAAAEERWEVGR